MAAYYNEIKPQTAARLRALIATGLIAPGEVDTRSITEVRPDDIKGFTQCHFFAGIGGWSYALRLAGWPDTRPVWTGSCPCQPFSIAGKRKGEGDERHLWPEFHRLIRQCRPATVFGEQVAGADGIAWADGVAQDLEAEGYAFGTLVLPGHIVRAPQDRKRIYFVAHAAVTDAAGRPADVRRHGRLPPLETSAWPPAPWQQRDADAGFVDDGLPAQLVKSILGDLGNSIIARAAAEFIQATDEAMNPSFQPIT